MIAVSIILLLLYAGLYAYSVNEVLNGNFKVILLYAVIFFPGYTLFLAMVYAGIQSPVLITILQYSKEVLIFGSFLLWVFGQKNIATRRWAISNLDYYFLGFIGLSIVYLILPIGEATFVNKAVYLKNILLIGLFYFFGRNISMEYKDWKVIFKVIFTMTVLACGLVILEKGFGIHFHSLVGYAQYNLHIKDIEPAGTYGLTWTFEAQGGSPRYASFFANPLEFSASMLVAVAIAIIHWLSVKFKENKQKYLFMLGAAFICVILAYSRATFGAFFAVIAFMAVMLKYYKILGTAFATFVAIGIYIFLFAEDTVRYFVIDTILFQNSSSVSHLIEWAQGLESMITNPWGIGLATSGNASGVESALQVGGENQFLIYGVQLGFVGLFLYLGMIIMGIRHSWRAFQMAENREASVVPFVAASVKFGLLLPLFTANAEVYIFIALLSWWMIGSAETTFQSVKRIPKTLSHLTLTH